MTTPYSKPKRDKKTQKKLLIALNKVIRKNFSFSPQVNIEVTRGHRRSNLAECYNIFFQKCAITSKHIIGKGPRKKQSKALFRQHVARIDLISTVLGTEVNKDYNSVFCKNGFLQITFELGKLVT